MDKTRENHEIYFTYTHLQKKKEKQKDKKIGKEILKFYRTELLNFY